jgi:hypothetical protein
MHHGVLMAAVVYALFQNGYQRCPDLVSPWANAREVWNIPFNPNGPNPLVAASSATHLFVVAEHARVPESLVRGGKGHMLGVATSVDGAPNVEVLLAPRGHEDLHAPRIAVDGSGMLHMVWGKVRIRRPPGASEDVHSFDVWASSYWRGRWLTPRRVADLNGPWWDHTLPSELVRTASGDLHAMAPSFRSDSNAYLLHVARIAGRWTTSRVAAQGTATYTALGTRNDSLFLAFVAPVIGPAPDASSVWFQLSPDGGRHWERPVLVSRSGELSARELRIVPERSGEIALVWARKREPNDFFSGVLWMSRSRDLGRTWAPPSATRPAERLHVMGAVEQATGVIDVVFWAGGSVGVARVCGSTWGNAITVPASLGATGSAAVVRRPDSLTEIVWSTVVRGERETPRRVWLRSILR